MLDDRVAGSLIVIPCERDLAHEVRVGRLETVESLEDVGETHDAALAADPADLDRVALRSHAGRVASKG